MKCLNRTFMELKQRSEGVRSHLLWSLNRTFMELKLLRYAKVAEFEGS